MFGDTVAFKFFWDVSDLNHWACQGRNHFGTGIEKNKKIRNHWITIGICQAVRLLKFSRWVGSWGWCLVAFFIFSLCLWWDLRASLATFLRNWRPDWIVLAPFSPIFEAQPQFPAENGCCPRLKTKATVSTTSKCANHATRNWDKCSSLVVFTVPLCKLLGPMQHAL